jgi:hypothetical protein
MEEIRIEAQLEDECPMSGTHIVAEVLKEHNSSSTFLSTMMHLLRSGWYRTSASSVRRKIWITEDRSNRGKCDIPTTINRER